MSNAIVVADQGAGKSTICSRCFEALLASYYARDDAPIPLFFDLEFTDLSTINSTVSSIVQLVSKSCTPNQRIVLILDSFDQSPDRSVVAKQLASLVGLSSAVTVTVFSREIRDALYLSEFLASLRVAPLDDDGLFEILSSVSQGAIERSDFNGLVDAGLIEGMRNPFWATMFALVARKGGLPKFDIGDRSRYELISKLEKLSLPEIQSSVRPNGGRLEERLAESTSKGFILRPDDENFSEGGSPFLYATETELRFRHDIFRDYFVGRYIASSKGVASFLFHAFRERRNQNLSFALYALSQEKLTRLRRWLKPIAVYSVRASSVWLGRYNPFLFLYIRALESMPNGDDRDDLIDELIAEMASDGSQFPFAYYLPSEIRGADYDDFRLQNSHLIVSQLRSERYREYLFDLNAKGVDRNSVFSFLSYRDRRSAEFLVEALARTQENREEKAHVDVTGLFYAGSVVTRFPFDLFPGMLYKHVDNDGPAVHALLRSLLHLLARRPVVPGRVSEKLSFDEESYLRVTQSEEWLDFLFYCFSEGESRLSQEALGCLKNHNWSGRLRSDIERRLIQMCEDERDEVRGRAVHASLYFKDARDLVENVLKSDEDPLTQLRALHVAWISHRRLFEKYGLDILFSNSTVGDLSQEKAEAFLSFALSEFAGSDVEKEEQMVRDLLKCLAVSVNAPTDMMRGWGVELLAIIDPKLAISIGSWIVLNIEDDSEDDHNGIFRSLHNIEGDLSADVVMRGLGSDNMHVVDIAICCVDNGNYSAEVKDALLKSRNRIPGGYGFLRDWIDKLIETEGAQYRD